MSHRPLWNICPQLEALKSSKIITHFSIETLIIFFYYSIETLIIFSIIDTSRRNIFFLNDPFKYDLYKNTQISQVVFLYKAVISSSVVVRSHRMKIVHFLQQWAIKTLQYLYSHYIAMGIQDCVGPWSFACWWVWEFGFECLPVVALLTYLVLLYTDIYLDSSVYEICGMIIICTRYIEWPQRKQLKLKQCVKL